MRLDEALASFDKALAIKPEFAAAWLGRGNVFHDTNRFAEAFAAYEKALAIRPDYFQALVQIASCHGQQGNLEAAVSFYDKALALRPDNPGAISNRIFLLDFVSNVGFAAHQVARKYWWQQVGAKVAAKSSPHHGNVLDKARRLVLGYVSADFNNHSAAAAFKPVLKNHDKTQFEVICYACSAVEDDVTRDFQAVADAWRNAAQWSDDRLAEQVRADGVDILIDLSGHSAGNRLAVFARKPAPIQVTAWGHGTGTGIPTMDYLFSDPVAAPAEVRHHFAEAIYDLPCLVTMEPPFSGFSPASPPVLSNGYVTFGVFNRVSKISDDAVRVWAEILHAVPLSRLLIKNQALDDASMRVLLTERFAKHGAPADRIDFLGSTTRMDHLLAYKDVDICLDPFPQNGGISTWEALHMGVPVVAKLGISIPGRLSGAIVSSIGLGEWVADSDEGYCAIAAKYASMPEHLATLRAALPGKIASSPAGNNAAYTKAVEAGYRAMWNDYIDGAAKKAVTSSQ
jgi:predicted O-linked N-acetylglucosamine transferase (SPINDLY family)